MNYRSCTQLREHTGKGHTFDPVSGWCIHGCGTRDDMITPAPLEPFDFTQEQTA